jgi:hypothetical protein
VPLYTRVCDSCRDKTGGLGINTIGADELSPLEPTDGVENVTMVVYIFRKSATGMEASFQQPESSTSKVQRHNEDRMLADVPNCCSQRSMGGNGFTLNEVGHPRSSKSQN